METLRPVVLATASQSRRALLAGAGVAFDAIASNIDESEIKAAAAEQGDDVATTALALAAAKAAFVSKQRPDALVIGADQMLELEGRWFDKPVDMPTARRQLMALRGKVHVLHSALVLRDGAAEIWRHVEPARLVMRDFSDDFLDAYLDDVGEDALKSVGGYFLEGLGAQLFEKVDGDYFTVLGLPMTPLLEALRQEKAIPR